MPQVRNVLAAAARALPTWRAVLDVALFAVPLGTALCVLGRWTTVDLPILVAATGFVPVAVVVAAITTVLAIVMRRRLAAVSGAVCLLATAAVVVPRFTVGQDGAPAGEPLTVVTANVHFRGDDVAGAVDAVTSTRAAIVALQEVTPDFAAALAPRAAAAGYRWTVVKAAWGSTGLAVLSRVPVVGHRDLAIAGQPLLQVDVAVAGVVLRLHDVHIEAPVSRSAVRRWRDQLEALRRLLDERGGGPVIAAGDFNATVDHLPFRRLLGGGRKDAVVERGRWLPTWPAGRRLVPSLLPLDHVVVSDGLAAAAARTALCPGSDHRMLIASLVVVAAPEGRRPARREGLSDQRPTPITIR